MGEKGGWKESDANESKQKYHFLFTVSIELLAQSLQRSDMGVT